MSTKNPREGISSPVEVEGASSAVAGPQQGEGGSAKAKAVAQERAAAAENSGPQTGVDAPAEDAARMPEQTVVAPDSTDGPLQAPQDALYQSNPVEGYGMSSTDHAYAAVGGRTVAGESHLGLVDEKGKAIKGDALFNDEPGKTFVTAKKRTYEQFYYPNTTEPASRLLFTEGQRVTRQEAERLKAEVS